MSKKIVIIGAGPGGYVAAIRAAQLGAEVTIIEKGVLGGTCLNEGCTPTKVLLHSADTFSSMNELEDMGIKLDGKVSVDWATLQGRKTGVVNHLTEGVAGLLRVNGVELIRGEASFIDSNNILVKQNDGETLELNADNIIIATGSKPFIPNIPGNDLEGVIDSTGALALEELPKEIVIVGAGIIGSEFGYLFNSLGVKVTILEMLPYIMPPIDREIASFALENLANRGIEFHTDATVNKISGERGNLVVEFTEDGKLESAIGDKVLLAVGRAPLLEGLNLEKVNVELEGRFVKVDDSLRTSVPNVYAIGDITGKNMLAHVASEQGALAAENIMGLNKKMKYNAIPSCVYIRPEIASVGLTEEAAKQKNISYKIGSFNFANNGKALILNEVENTVVKILSDTKYEQIIGVHIYGPRATDIIHEVTLAIRLEATLDELISTIHAHPTVSESIKEAALATNKIAIHAINE